MLGINHKAWRLCLFLVLLACAILQLWLALFEQSQYSQKTNISSQHKYQSNPYLLSWLAKQKHIFDADLSTAETFYQQALIANPVYLPAWLGLAELKQDQQKAEQANDILDYTSDLAKDIKRWRWDKALVAYQFGRNDVLATDLSYIVSKMPGKIRNDALRMAFSVWPDPMELQETLGNENLLHLFRYASRKKKVEAGLVFWDTLEAQGVEEQEKDVLNFINMLISVKEIDTAAGIWKKHFNSKNILFNGDFTEKPMQTAFGWRIGKTIGASWKLREAKKKGEPASLHLHFNRKKNINFHKLYQIVPLQGGKVYLLKGKVKTAKLSTDQRPFLQAYGYQCKSTATKTEMVASDQEWTDVYLQINVPEECDAMIIRLRRHESTQIDNKMAGDIWLAGFEIVETREHFTILDEQQ